MDGATTRDLRTALGPPPVAETGLSVRREASAPRALAVNTARLSYVPAAAMRIAIWVWLLLVAGCAASRPALPRPTPGRPQLTIMTYNLNFGLAGDPGAIEAIRRARADVVLLQETNEGWEQALRAGLSDEYPHMHFRHCCQAGGLAVLSRHPVLDQATTHPSFAWFPAWRVIVRTPLGPIQVLNLHLRPGVSDSGSWVSGAWTTPRVRVAEVRRHYRGVDRGVPTIVVGDLNEGSSGHAVAWLEAQGLTDVLPRFAGSAATWRWPTSVGTLSLQLDHVLHDDRLRALRARVLPAGRSDHLPVVATFERANLDAAGRTSR